MTTPRDEMALVERLRSLEADHTPDGWPAVKMHEISTLLDALTAQAAEIAELRHDIERYVQTNAELATENEQLREKVERLEGESLSEQQLRDLAQSSSMMLTLCDFLRGKGDKERLSECHDKVHAVWWHVTKARRAIEGAKP